MNKSNTGQPITEFQFSLQVEDLLKIFGQKECLKRTCHKEKKICPQFGVDLTKREYELKQKYVDRGFGRCIDLPFRFKNKDNKE